MTISNKNNLAITITFSAIAALILTLTESIAFAKLVNESQTRPNIIFIMADDLNDFIGVMNSDSGTVTPNIDSIANKGTLFTNAHSNAPVCSPSRASLFSGILPHQSGHYAFNHWRKNKVLVNSNTISEQLTKHGYYTAGSGKLFHHQWPKAWDDFGIRPDYTPLAYNGEKAVGHPDGPSPYNTKIGPLDATFMPLSAVPHVKPDGKTPGYHGWWYNGFKKPFKYISEQERDPLPDEIYANWAVGKIQQWDSEKLAKPFFLSVGFIRPHTPLVVPDRFYDMFPLDNISLPEFVDDDEDDTHFESIFRGKPSKGKKHYTTLMASFDTKTQALKRYYQAYLASVAFMDEQVGKILTALENSRFKDNTIVVFTSDHGYNLGEKENLFKNNLWERSTRVPLIIYDSRTNTKQSINAPVSLVDLFPTFTDYANAVSDNRKNDKGLPITGNSLLPLIQGNDSIERHALTVVRTGGDKGGQSHFALRTENWRYILYANGKEELYDHKSDTDEIYNLALDDKYQDVKRQLKHQLLELTADAK